MQKTFKILDCTLRDGGYYTNWDFDKHLVKEYCEAMESLPIDYVEVGYRSISLDGYLGEYFYCPEYLMKELKEMMPNKKLVIILDEKNTNLEDIDELIDPCKGYIDMIRMAIAPNKFDNAIRLAKKIKEKGFEVGFNIMYMSSWKEDTNFINKIGQVTGLVDYFYMVDSYGGVVPKDVKEIVKLIKDQTDVSLGFHGHDNLEMGLINSITAVEIGCSIIDSTITGMGRGAGNLKTELLMTYLSKSKDWNISFNALSSVVSDFEDLQKEYNWGTSLPYMVSGAYSLPQKDVMSWMSKRRYSISGIVNALQERVNDDKAFKFEVLQQEQRFSRAIIIGGGNLAISNMRAIKAYIKLIESQEKVCLIHASTRHVKVYNEINVPQFFCLVGNEGHRLQKIFKDLSLIAHKFVLPYKRFMGSFVPQEIVKDTFQLPNNSFTDKYEDSPLATAINVSRYFNVKTIDFIGFDGYDVTYRKSEFEISKENQYLFNKLDETGMEFSSLTQTKYQLKESSIYSSLK